MKVLVFKTNNKLMAYQTGNNFGDQIIEVINIDKPTEPIMIISFPEGNWIDFTEKSIKRFL